MVFPSTIHSCENSILNANVEHRTLNVERPIRHSIDFEKDFNNGGRISIIFLIPGVFEISGGECLPI